MKRSAHSAATTTINTSAPAAAVVKQNITNKKHCNVTTISGGGSSSINNNNLMEESNSSIADLSVESFDNYDDSMLDLGDDDFDLNSPSAKRSHVKQPFLFSHFQ